MSINTEPSVVNTVAAPVATLAKDGPHVAVITMNNPPANVLTVDLRRALHEIFDELERDLDVRAVVIASDQPQYTAGGDLKEDQSLTNDDVRHYIEEFFSVLERIERFRTPVIAAINGGSIGGGLEFVLACDVRIASTEAFFVAAGVNVGLIVSFWRLPRVVGLGAAKEILLTGSRYTAAQALNWGLVTEVHEPDALLGAALAKAHRIASRAPLSVELTKKSASEALDLTAQQGDELQIERFLQMFRTRDHQEALDAFFGRREGNYERR
ncbi:enoyl-CoA hydratase/isomerase family protein [Gordonia terrae]|nr:enoyl-CoA hydratase/isomerase family protein [Gordonia terrae]GAB42096.1 putative enoyl-CoA hydratase [Gordonia terrae NBRC 100016]VTR07679.1 Enoyl-CoA hydratase/isomerase [Clostridioides difficile]VTS55488.1 Probable enoyl-CoA hydratase echA8 [Gordonia terrae]